MIDEGNKINKYEVGRPLQKGYYSMVHEGRDTITNQKVAIKEVNKNLEEIYLEKAIMQKELLEEFKSPVTVELIDYVTIKDSLDLLVMELCDTDLRAHIYENRAKPLSIYLVRKILCQLKYIMQQINDKGITFRRFKPENMLIKYTDDTKKDFNMKFFNFEYSNNIRDILIHYTYRGPEYYESPEISTGALYQDNSDIWSTGCILYLCLNQKEAFTDGRYRERGYVEKERVKRRYFRHKDLLDLLDKCLVFNYQERIKWNDFFNDKLFKKIESLDFKKEELDEVYDKYKEYKDKENNTIIQEIDDFFIKYYGDVLKDTTKKHGCGILLKKHEGVIYKGIFQNDVITGPGELLDYDGTFYEGEFINGIFFGKGSIKFTNGDEFNGEFYDGEMKKGIFIYANKDDNNYIYEGDLRREKRHGKGMMKYRNKDKYNGEWKHNRKHGKGILNCKEGNYEGDFYKDCFEGEGTYNYNNGSIYKGRWKKNKKNGKGIFINKDYEYDGYWKNDLKNGKGKFIGGKYKYDGEWKNNLKDGYGILEFNDCIYKGEFKNDEFNGKGKMIYGKSGDYLEYNGDWKEGMFHGKGLLKFKNNDEYCGNFNNGEIENEGAFKNKKNEMLYGNWKLINNNEYYCDYGEILYENGDKFIGKINSKEGIFGEGLKFEKPLNENDKHLIIQYDEKCKEIRRYNNINEDIEKLIEELKEKDENYKKKKEELKKKNNEEDSKIDIDKNEEVSLENNSESYNNDNVKETKNDDIEMNEENFENKNRMDFDN